MSDTPSVQEALAAVMAAVRSVGKDDYNQHQKFNFRGVDAVVNAIGPALRDHGVIVLPDLQSFQSGEYHTTKGAQMRSVTVHVRYTFVGPKGDELVCSVLGEASDSGDKAVPKAMSVAFRTALLQALCLPTDEPDPDSQSHERTTAPVQQPAEPDWVALGWKDQADHDEAKALIKGSASLLSDDSKEALKAWAPGNVKVVMSREEVDRYADQVKALAAGDPPSQDD